MSQLFYSMQAGLENFIQDGQYLMLFMAALLLLWLSESSRKKELVFFSFIMLVALLFPLTTRFLLLYQTNYYTYESLWGLLPMTPVLAYGLVVAFSRTVTTFTRVYGRWKSVAPKSKEYAYEVLVTAVLTTLLFLCGSLSFGKVMSDETFSGNRMPEDVTIVLEELTIEEDEVFLLAPDEILTWARSYSGHLLLPYGRNMFETGLSGYTYDVYSESLRELHDWINGSGLYTETGVHTEENLLSRCASANYDYLVFDQERTEQDAFSRAITGQDGYQEFARVAGYVIYRLQ